MEQEIEKLKTEIEKLKLELEIAKVNLEIEKQKIVYPVYPSYPVYPNYIQPLTTSPHYHGTMPCWNNPCVWC